MEYVYVGRRVCGCIVAACIIMEDDLSETANTVAEFIRDGLTIDRMELSEYKKTSWECSHLPTQQEMDV